MRILIYAMGSAGDVHPFAGIGRALKARGHEVFVITSPYFEDVVHRAGLEFRPMGSIADFERVQADPHLWHPTKALPSIIRNAVDPSYEPILEHARELHLPGKTVILASSLGWGAMVVRELLGIPVATPAGAPRRSGATGRAAMDEVAAMVGGGQGGRLPCTPRPQPLPQVPRPAPGARDAEPLAFARPGHRAVPRLVRPAAAGLAGADPRHRLSDV
jgi:hypothetical protein